MVMATKPRHIFFAFQEVGIDCLEKNHRSRNRVLDMNMLLLQVRCTLGRELVGSTRGIILGIRCGRVASKEISSHLVKSSFGNAPYLCHCRF
jgi:hypothetical protein